MRLMRASVTPCDQAREYISLALDGELAEVERVRLEAHTAGCAECRAYATDVEAATLELRAAEPEQPADAFVPPRTRRLTVRTFQLASAAAAVAAIIAAGSVFQGIGRPSANQSIGISQSSLFRAGDDVAPNLHPTKQRPIKHVAV
jgi:predicted anti-sigma-YlaC factor YlaD